MYSKYLKPPSDKKEMHIPGYNYCGPGTDVEGRFRRGDKGVNDLDNACKRHDAEYIYYQSDPEKLMESDKRLAESAERIMQKIKENTSIISKTAEFLLGKGIPIGFHYIERLITSPDKFKEDVAAALVSNIFKQKGQLEAAIGVLGFKGAPSAFAKGISSYTDEEARELGKNLLELI